MTTLTRPDWFRPRDCTLALRKSGLQFVSPFNGTMQAIDTLAERWVFNLAMPGAADGGARSAFFNQWAGGVNHVALYHFGRPQPLGTLRGAPTLASATARGDASLALVGARARNALLGGSFEADTNADGVADGWTRYQSGTYSGLTQSVSAGGTHGANAQLLSASTLGGTTADQQGVWRSGVLVSHLAGTSVTVAAQAYGASGQVAVLVEWVSGGGSVLSTLTASAAVNPSTWVTVSATGTAPASAVTANVYVYQHSAGAGAQYVYLDAVQLVPGAAAAYPDAATLLAGDMLAAGGQLYQVASNCTATDAGAITVPVVNRARGVVASGTAVQWDRPTALFALPAMEQSVTWLRGGNVDGVLVDAVEVY